MRKLFLTLLTAMMLTMLPSMAMASQMSGYCGAPANGEIVSDENPVGNNVTWELTENDDVLLDNKQAYTLTIGGKGAMADYEKPGTAPWCSALPDMEYQSVITKIDIGKKITVVGNNSFVWLKGVTSVSFEDGSLLKEIRLNGFHSLIKLTEINLPAKLEIIGDAAFYGCSTLETVILANPDILIEVNTSAFASCLELVYFNNTEKSSTCSWLPKNLNIIGNNSFQKDSKLIGELLIPADIEYLSGSFWGLASITKLTFEDTSFTFETPGCFTVTATKTGNEFYAKTTTSMTVFVLVAEQELSMPSTAGELPEIGEQPATIVMISEIADADKDAFELESDQIEEATFYLHALVDDVVVDKAKFDNAVTVRIPYLVEDEKIYKVFHKKHDGAVEILDANVNIADQELTFELSSLSPFMVVSMPKPVVTGGVKHYNNTLEEGKGGDAMVQPLSASAGTKVWITPKADKGYEIDEVVVDDGDIKVTDNGDFWYSEAQAWAMEAGISDGTNMTNEITREQLVTMLYRYAMTNGEDTRANADLTKFADYEKVSAYAIDAFKWAVAKEIINGDNNGNLNPRGNATRSELAKIMVSYVD